MRESRILVNNAAVVESMFRELGPGFTTCFRYEDMSDPSQANRVATFVAPTKYVAQRLANKMLENAKPRPNPVEQVNQVLRSVSVLLLGFLSGFACA